MVSGVARARYLSVSVAKAIANPSEMVSRRLVACLVGWQAEECLAWWLASTVAGSLGQKPALTAASSGSTHRARWRDGH